MNFGVNRVAGTLLFLLKPSGKEADERHVGGIVIVEELAEPLQPSSLPVVHRQQRHCQPAGQVNHSVGGAVEDEEGDGVERDDGHHPEHLLVEAVPVPANHEYGQRGGTTPVRGAGEQAGHQRDTCLLPSCKSLHVPYFQQYQPQEQRPGDARGIEEQVAERVEARHIEIAEGKVAHYGQHEQTAQIAAEVVRVVIALGHEEYLRLPAPGLSDDDADSMSNGTQMKIFAQYYQ